MCVSSIVSAVCVYWACVYCRVCLVLRAVMRVLPGRLWALSWRPHPCTRPRSLHPCPSSWRKLSGLLAGWATVSLPAHGDQLRGCGQGIRGDFKEVWSLDVDVCVYTVWMCVCVVCVCMNMCVWCVCIWMCVCVVSKQCKKPLVCCNPRSQKKPVFEFVYKHKAES